MDGWMDQTVMVCVDAQHQQEEQEREMVVPDWYKVS